MMVKEMGIGENTQGIGLRETFPETVNLDWMTKELIIIDQTKLPTKMELIRLKTAKEIWEAIYFLKVRGAPAIGVAAALGIYGLATQIQADKFLPFYQEFSRLREYLSSL